MPRDDVLPDTPPKASSRGPLLERWFDEHSDGKFVKTLLISMLLIATVVQPFSLIYTAYGEHLPDHWWAWTPALAMLLFVALDWTILPLAYFFATTHKISLKIVLALMLSIVLFGAFEGYFTATERLISMRLQDITKHRLALEQHQDEVAGLKAARDEAERQGEKDRDVFAKQREELTTQFAQIDAQIAAAQKTLDGADAQYLKAMTVIADHCLKVAYVCLKPEQDAERARYEAARTDLQKQITMGQASKASLNERLAGLPDKGGEKVGVADTDLKAGNTRLNEVRKDFDAAVLDSQVYRWAGALMGVSPRLVTAEQANRVLDIFAAAVAVSYVVAQALLAISYYGRRKPSFLQVTTPFWTESWRRILRGVRAYYARKRRTVYRDRVQVQEKEVIVYQDRVQEKQVIVPSGERVRIVYVPVPPGGHVPPPEEILTKNPRVANGQQ
jgi:hypothetical protein